MPSIEIPPATGVLPDVRVNYNTTLGGPMTYSATINVVGTYTERYMHPEIVRVERWAWQGETEHETEEAALTEAVEKLAKMIERLA